jgi:Ni,Fe-hydrogenase III small subunit
MQTNRQTRRTALWVLPLESGGCGACTQQVYALLAPRYASQLRAHGISFARSPRHADVVLVAGPLSRAAREPIERVLAGVPPPRALVAVGNCAIGGCVFRDSPQVVSDVAEALDVNVEIAGCPPSPRAILDAIVEAGQLLAAEQDWADDTASAGSDAADEADGAVTLEDLDAADGSEDDSEQGGVE